MWPPNETTADHTNVADDEKRMSGKRLAFVDDNRRKMTHAKLQRRERKTSYKW